MYHYMNSVTVITPFSSASGSEHKSAVRCTVQW